jgi:hypothetical protein
MTIWIERLDAACKRWYRDKIWTNLDHAMSAQPQPGDKSLFIVESPFQLLCAFEVITRYELNYVLILRMSGVGRNDEQLRVTARMLHISCVEIVARVGMLRKDLLRAWSELLPLLARRYRHVFLGSYYSGLIRLLRRVIRSGHTWLLDDGLATLRAQAEMVRTGKAENLVTCLEPHALPGQTILHHRLESITALNATNYVNQSIFLGQPYVELEMISNAVYDSIVEACSKASVSSLIYVPHRSERTGRIAEMKLKFGLEIYEPPTCIELDLVKNGQIPRNVFTIMSTAGFTVARMFPEATVTLFPKFLYGTSAPVDELVAYARGFPNIKLDATVAAFDKLV